MITRIGKRPNIQRLIAVICRVAETTVEYARYEYTRARRIDRGATMACHNVRPESRHAYKQEAA